MTTKEIYLLLIEASISVINGDGCKVNEIQVKLEDSIKHSTNLGKYDNARYAGIELVLGSLYVDVLNNNPKLLPKLLPVFALMCADNTDNSMLGDIDWDFVNVIM